MHMKHLIGITLLALGITSATPHAQAANCGLQMGTAVAFCETFDQPAAINSRAGQLNSAIWGVSRAIGIGGNNFGQGQYNQWPSTLLQKCDGTTPRVTPPNDVIICNGQLREASNDNMSGGFEAGDITVLAMYPKQPFDFAGRTGTVAFDVSNDTHGNHAAWPEFWLTDLPIPAPFTHGGTWVSNPQHGFGIRFGADALPGQQGLCQNQNNLNALRWTVDSAVIIRNYVMEDTFMGSQSFTVTPTDCVKAPTAIGQLNHVELRIAQNQIDVYASDAGATALRRIAVVGNANLSLTRGLIWLEDVHYNADKGDAPSQREHTFAWDNVAFDGPFTYKDQSYDALDALTPSTNGSVLLGQFFVPNQQLPTWNVLNMPAAPQAQAVRVLFNFFPYTPPSSLNVTVNGHAHPTAWPYPDTQGFSWRTMAVTIPITDLVTGTNVVSVGGDQAFVVSNVNIVLVNVGAAQPPAVSVAISPKTVGLSSGASQAFACTVTGSSNTACTWAVTEGAAGGSVTSGGLYTAPSAAGTYHVRVTSQADASKSDTATITVSAPTCESVVRLNGTLGYVTQPASVCAGAHP